MWKTSSQDAGQVIYGELAIEATLVGSDSCKEREGEALKSVENDMDKKARVCRVLMRVQSTCSIYLHLRLRISLVVSRISHKFIHFHRHRVGVLSTPYKPAILAMCTVLCPMDILIFAERPFESRDLPSDVPVSSCP